MTRARRLSGSVLRSVPTTGIALQFFAAWLLKPAGLGKGTWVFWRRYAATVVICMIGGLVAAFIFFITDHDRRCLPTTSASIAKISATGALPDRPR